jgi:hypothetical protein
MKKSTEAVLKAWREVNLEVNSEKSRYIFMFLTRIQEKLQFIYC